MKGDSIYIYTDASFDKKSGIAVLGFGAFESTEQHETCSLSDLSLKILEVPEKNNIRAELRASLMGLKTFKTTKKVTLYTDCQTTCSLLSRREKLERTKFISQSKNLPLANADLYQEFYALYDKILPEIVWVKGHSKDKVTRVQKNFSYLDKEVRKSLRGKS